MPFEYFEITRRKLAENVPSIDPPNETKQSRMARHAQSHTSVGTIKPALDALGADDWELVSVTELRDSNSEILYTFKKTI